MFCTRIKAQLKALLRQFDLYIDTHIDQALQITSALKSILSSPAANIITSIIPGNLDNALQQLMITALDKAVEALSIAEQCKQYTDINDKLNCFIQQLRQRDPQLQEAILQKLASLLAGQLDGNRLQQNLYDLYTQAKYSAAKSS